MDPEKHVAFCLRCETCYNEFTPDDDQRRELEETDHIVCPRCGTEGSG